MTKPTFPLPLNTAPMEAKLTDSIPTEEGWQFEPKWDGFRCLVFKTDADVDLPAKSGKPLGRYFPELIEQLRRTAPKRFVVDGEIVIAMKGGYSFDALQMRLHPAESRIRKLSLETPAKLVLFDMLADLSGKVYRSAPFCKTSRSIELRQLFEE